MLSSRQASVCLSSPGCNRSGLWRLQARCSTLQIPHPRSHPHLRGRAVTPSRPHSHSCRLVRCYQQGSSKSEGGGGGSEGMADYDKEFVTEHLLSPVKVGSLQLKHRVVMAAMTRTRNDPITEAPREINKLYYSQRSSDGGLLLTEGAAPSWAGRGYIRAPGVWTDAHIEGWKPVTEEVHRKGGFIFVQLMHAGRISHSSLLPNNQLPVAPSAVKPEGLVHIKDGKAPYEEPRALELHELPGVVQEFVSAAKRSIEAGFDGIELHSGNGYLLQQFLAKDTNRRTDEYGGSVENRARFLLEVVDAVSEAIGSEKVGIKLQQGVTFSGLVEPEDDSFAQLAYLGPELDKRNIAFVEMSSLNYAPYFSFLGLKEPNFKKDVWKFFREHYKGTIIINGGLAPQQAAEYVKDGTADLASFGVAYLANANLPDLLRAGKELNQGGWTTSIWYSKNPEKDVHGYTDWPLVEVIKEAVKSAVDAVGTVVEEGLKKVGIDKEK